jgi:hypothetical protein
MKKTAAAPKSAAPDLAALRAKTDPRVVMRLRILVQLAKLKTKGPEAWQKEVEFLRDAGVNNHNVKFIRKEFDKFTAEVQEIGKKSGYRVWFHDARIAGAFRAEQEKLRAISDEPTEE